MCFLVGSQDDQRGQSIHGQHRSRDYAGILLAISFFFGVLPLLSLITIRLSVWNAKSPSTATRKLRIT